MQQEENIFYITNLRLSKKKIFSRLKKMPRPLQLQRKKTLLGIQFQKQDIDSIRY